MWAANSTDLFSSRDISMMIELVQAFPVLYAAKKSHFKSIVPKEKAWKIIATKLNRSVPECEKKWRYLRDKYVKERRRLYEETANGDNSGCQQSKWHYYEPMNFLDEHLKRLDEKWAMALEESNQDGDSINQCDILDLKDPFLVQQVHGNTSNQQGETLNGSNLLITPEVVKTSSLVSENSSGSPGSSTCSNPAPSGSSKRRKQVHATLTIPEYTRENLPSTSQNNFAFVSPPQLGNPMTNPMYGGNIENQSTLQALSRFNAFQQNGVIPDVWAMWMNNRMAQMSAAAAMAAQREMQAGVSNQKEEKSTNLHSSNTQERKNVSEANLTLPKKEKLVNGIKRKRGKQAHDINIRLFVDETKHSDKLCEYNFSLSLAQMLEDVPKQRRTDLKIKLMQLVSEAQNVENSIQNGDANF